LRRNTLGILFRWIHPPVMNDSLPATATQADELPTFDNYRPLSVGAIGALLLGLASAAVLVTPVLAIVPLAAIVAAVIALRAIAAAPQALGGKSLAVAGLCLAMLFLGWGLARHFHHQAHVRETAREFADDCLKILATGDLPRAYQLHVAREYRQDPRSIKARPKLSKDGEEDFGMISFFDDSAMKKFLAAGPDVKFQFEEVALQSRDSLADEITLQYQIDTPKERFPLFVTVRRTFGNVFRKPDWELHSVLHEPPGR
jgi:hypothetical protein